jgi:hypothetical protein
MITIVGWLIILLITIITIGGVVILVLQLSKQKPPSPVSPTPSPTPSGPSPVSSPLCSNITLPNNEKVEDICKGISPTSDGRYCLYSTVNGIKCLQDTGDCKEGNKHNPPCPNSPKNIDDVCYCYSS